MKQTHTFTCFGEIATVTIENDLALYKLPRWTDASEMSLVDFLDTFGECYANGTETTLNELL